MAARILSVALTLVCLEATVLADRDQTAEAKMTAGGESFDRGQLQEAVRRWKEAEQNFAKAKDTGGEVRALLREADAFQALGQHRLALSALSAGDELAEKAKDPRAIAQLKAARGTIDIFSHESDQAEPLLRDALKAARAAKDAALTATVLNDLGILLTAQGHTKEALASFEEAAGMGDPLLAAKAKRNMADAAFAAGDFVGAERFADQAAKAASALPDDHEKAFLLIGAAQMLQKIFVEAPAHKNALRAEAFRLDQEAAQVAGKTGDQRALAFALGGQGALYEFEKRYGDALTLTRRAVFAAQQTQSPDTLYCWEWQSGRLLAKQGERDAAIQAYQRTITALRQHQCPLLVPRHGRRGLLRTRRSSARTGRRREG
jgi:tetratricopeptide (TPR) repeat protein